MSSIIEFTSHGEKRPNGQVAILVLKLDHRGDLVTGLSALSILRTLLPEALITLVVSSWNESFAQTLKTINKVLVFNFFSEDGKSMQAGSDLNSILPPDHAFDLALDLRVDNDTRFLLENVNARIKAGFSSQFDNVFLHLKMNLPEISSGSRDLVLQKIDYRVTSQAGERFYRWQAPLKGPCEVTFDFVSIYVGEKKSQINAGPSLGFAVSSVGLHPLRLKVTLQVFSGHKQIAEAKMETMQILPFLKRTFSFPLQLETTQLDDTLHFHITADCHSGKGTFSLTEFPWSDPAGAAAINYERALLHRSEQYAALAAAAVQRLNRPALKTTIVSE